MIYFKASYRIIVITNVTAIVASDAAINEIRFPADSPINAGSPRRPPAAVKKNILQPVNPTIAPPTAFPIIEAMSGVRSCKQTPKIAGSEIPPVTR